MTWGQEDTALLSLRAGADINGCYMDPYNSSPIQIAMLDGNENLVLFCIENGADIERLPHPLWDNDSPLLLALRQGLPRAAKLLLEKGAGVQEDEKDMIVTSISKESTSILPILIQRGANVDGPGWGATTTLELAVCALDTEVIEVLLLYGANPLAVSNIRTFSASTLM